MGNVSKSHERFEVCLEVGNLKRINFDPCRILVRSKETPCKILFGLESEVAKFRCL